MGMRTEHLTPDELEAFSRGEVTDLSVGLHLRNCAECREAAREAEFGARYLRPLAGDHPDEDVLTALWSHALPPSRETELRSHVDTCSRCRSVLARLESATPVAAHPHQVSEKAIARTRAWAVASSGPRRATLVVRAAEGLNRLRTSLESLAESLQFGGLRPEPTSLRFDVHRLEEFEALRAPQPYSVESLRDRAIESANDDAADAEASERELRRRRSEEMAGDGKAAAGAGEQFRPAPTVLNDGHHAFRFETKREGAATRLVVVFVETKRPPEAAAVGVTFDSPGYPTRRADLVLGGEAVFEIAPGASHLSIGVRPSWEIEIHLDA